MDDEQVEQFVNAIYSLRDSISPFANLPGDCPSGNGKVGCLVESFMGVTSGLCKIAEAIEDLADAVRSGNFEKT